ncbi:MAG: bifunctional precorrin-2 dehydrogenase/sirohydrochlorin ferrochelatase [Candidatus Adiutrix sp.]|jgi:siroheme synthase-like protein|nr:bifunctional precorrin-2 dehydrogenase/sirohydrochlorin ferrochelatase [Candidatus Adiutrix sp.]
MDMFPISLNLKGRLTLLVGAGRVGRRKLAKILLAGARIRLVEPNPSPDITRLAESGRLEMSAHYTPKLLEGLPLVFLATSDPAFNRKVAEEARGRGCWVNVADDPEASDFILPAVVERGDFQIAVTTGGASPALAASAAARLSEMFGPEYGPLTRLMAALRPMIMSSGLPTNTRGSLFKCVVASEPLRNHLARGETEAAKAVVSQLLAPLQMDGCFSLTGDVLE